MGEKVRESGGTEREGEWSCLKWESPSESRE